MLMSAVTPGKTFRFARDIASKYLQFPSPPSAVSQNTNCLYITMPIVSRTMRWPKSENVLRQETLTKIDARKARTAVTTAKLVLTLISIHRCKPGPKSRCVRSDRAQLSRRNDFCLRFWVYDARSRSKQEWETGKRSENYAHGSSSKGYLSSTFIESIHLLVRYQKKSQRPKRRPWRGYQPHIP